VDDFLEFSIFSISVNGKFNFAINRLTMRLSLFTGTIITLFGLSRRLTRIDNAIAGKFLSITENSVIIFVIIRDLRKW